MNITPLFALALIGCFNLIAIWALYSYLRRRLYDIEADTTNCYHIIMHFEKNGILDRSELFKQIELAKKEKGNPGNP